MKQYAIFDQTTGEYSFYDYFKVDTDNQLVNIKEETTEILAKKMLDIHLRMTNNHSICIIIEEVVNSDNSIEYQQYDIFGNLLPDFISSKLPTAIFQKQ